MEHHSTTQATYLQLACSKSRSIESAPLSWAPGCRMRAYAGQSLFSRMLGRGPAHFVYLKPTIGRLASSKIQQPPSLA